MMPSVPLSTMLAFAATCLVIELTPGPNMVYLALLSVSHGRRAGFAAVMGVGLGLLIIGLAAALGLAAVISNSPFLYEALRWGGVAYLIWLAWEGWQTALETSPGKAHAVERHAKHFTRGLITNVLNPKAGIFYIAILPTFVDASKNVVNQTIALSVLFVAIATAMHITVISLAGTARPLLDDQRRRTIIRRVLAVVLAGIAIWFAAATQR